MSSPRILAKTRLSIVSKHSKDNPVIKKMNSLKRYTCTLLFVLLQLVQQGLCAIHCKHPVIGEPVLWRTTPTNFTIAWLVDKVCKSSQQCLGAQVNESVHSWIKAVQLCPVFMQEGDNLYITPPTKNVFGFNPVSLSSLEDWKNCRTNIGTGLTLNSVNSDGSNKLLVDSNFIRKPVNYFAQNDSLTTCKSGLRARVKVKQNQCGSDANFCSGHGKCITTLLKDSYTCHCDRRYKGSLCDEIDGCVSDPCKNNGTCTDAIQGLEGTNYTCSCPDPFTGINCTEVKGVCRTGLCNNGTCVAIESQAFRCDCSEGYTGVYVLSQYSPPDIFWP
jgi:hypothetical protein